MQVVVIKSPKCLRGVLRRLFGIKKDKKKYRGRQLLRYFLWHIILLWYRSDPALGQRGQR